MSGTGTGNRNEIRPHWSMILGTAVVFIALVAAWRFTPLAQIAAPEIVGGWARRLGSQPWAPFVVVLAYTPACIVMFPRPLITLAAVLAFGPGTGFVYAMSGILLATLITYSAGRLTDAATVRRLAGQRLVELSGIVRDHGLFAVAAIRFLPVAPFVVGNLLAGAVRIRLWHVIGGTFLGMLPGTLMATIFGDQIEAGLSNPARINLWIVGSTLAVFAGAAFVARRWFARLQHDRSEPRPR